MKNLRQSFTLLLLSLLLLLPNLTFAQELNSSINAIPIKELDAITIEDTYTVSEILTNMEKLGNTKEELDDFEKNHQVNLRNLNLQENTCMSVTSTTIKYTVVRMDGIRFSKGFRTYRLQPEVLVGFEFRGGPSPTRMVSLESPYVYTGNGDAASFVGQMTYKLVAGNEIYTLIQGKAYKDGQMKVTGKVQVGLGKSATASISVEGGNGLLRDISRQDRYYSAGMSK